MGEVNIIFENIRIQKIQFICIKPLIVPLKYILHYPPP